MLVASVPPRETRPWDIVIFGATGFAGRLVAAYLDQHAPPGLRIALAGRNHERLAAIADELQREFGVLTASVDDDASLRSLAESTRVLLTTVGPYARLGEPVVAACVAAGTDYLDLTGEPAFVDRVLARHDAAAREHGALIVHCCGFDSIPTDLGVLFTVMQLPRDRPIAIDGYFEGKGGFSGGTFASALGAFAEPRARKPARAPTPPGAPLVGKARRGLHYQQQMQRWALPFPTIDPQIALRSARARGDYGPEFRYGHYLCLKSLPQVVGAVAGVGGLAVLARLGPTRRLLQRMHPPGSGPDAATRKKSWYRFTFRGRAGDVSVVTEVAGGDPGYDETARMIAESALCLLLERDKLPTGGVLTTATAMGERLLARLQAAGMSFRVLEGGRA